MIKTMICGILFSLLQFLFYKLTPLNVSFATYFAGTKKSLTHSTVYFINDIIKQRIR